MSINNGLKYFLRHIIPSPNGGGPTPVLLAWGEAVALFLFFALPSHAITKNKRSLLHRIHTYATTLDTTNISDTLTFGYGKATLRVEKRNPVLMLVPTAYVLSKGKQREFITETYVRLNVHGHNDVDIKPLFRLTTIPHRRRTMYNFEKYLTPTIYEETIVNNTILSPFHPNNFRFYKYTIKPLQGDTVEIRFRSKRRNTQLVRGSAMVDRLTGRIISCNYRGEYDMIRSWVSLEMGERGYRSLFPNKCEALFRFSFLGNNISAHYNANYGLPQVLPDSILNKQGKEDIANLMSAVRPDTLIDYEQDIYRQKLTADIEKKMRDEADTVRHKKSGWVKNILWDVVGDNVLNRVKMRFGQRSQGYIRVNPILNPLYMGYSDRKGFVYKFNLHAEYQINEKQELSARFKGGYSFRQEQFYFRLPVFYYMSRRKNRYFKFEIGNGNRISNNRISHDMNINAPFDGSLQLLNPEVFNEFKQTDSRLVLNYDFSSKIGIQVGALYQKWKAVNPYAFHIIGWQASYSSFAPVFELQYRPIGWEGPILTIDYDRGIKGVMNSNTEYERYEFNAEYIHKINRLQSLQMRIGSGLYTNKGRNAYFLNYENFRENNIPGGWNDDWSGEFELLRSVNYNTSDYYVRANLTYESPLLILSWLPWIGHYMEMERVYVSALDVRNAHPYMELGYGFTTRLFSMGLFVSNGKGNRTIGCKFGFELFRHW